MDNEPQTPPSLLSGQGPPSSPLSSLPSRPPSSDGSASPLASQPEAPNAEEDDERDSPPAKKRKKGCPSSAAISSSVRATVIRKAGGKCWLCGLNGVHIAHVIARSETVLFSEYKHSGLVHMDSLNELQNLIYLCAGCHHTFDARVPIWAFLPVDLDYFISQESAFHRARAHAASLGLPLSRPDPCNGTIPSLRYGRYQIRPNYLHNINFLAQPTKRWFGNPIAAILRSAGIFAGVQRLDPATQGGLPEDVARKFHELLFLYGVPAPPLLSLPVTVDLVGRGVGPSASGHTPPSPGLPRDRDTTPSSRALPETKPHGITRRETGNKDGRNHQALLTPPHTSQPVRCKRGRQGETPAWVFGPKMTANMLMRWSLDSLEMEAEDDAWKGRK